MEHPSILLVISALFFALYFVTDGHQNCNIVQMMVVKKQWSQVFAVSKGRKNRVDIGLEIWTDMFEKFPEVKSKYLRRVNAANLTSHAFTDFSLNVLSGFDIAVSFFGDRKTLQAQLDHLKQKHDYEDPIPEKCFDLFLESLMRIVQEKIGDTFDKAAWTNCGGYIMEGIH